MEENLTFKGMPPEHIKDNVDIEEFKQKYKKWITWFESREKSRTGKIKYAIWGGKLTKQFKYWLEIERWKRMEGIWKYKKEQETKRERQEWEIELDNKIERRNKLYNEIKVKVEVKNVR